MSSDRASFFFNAPFHVLHAVVNGEGQFLQRRRASLADVVAGDGNGVEARSKGRAKLKCVDHQPHAPCGRIKCSRVDSSFHTPFAASVFELEPAYEFQMLSVVAKKLVLNIS
jgi:hypothetical protein